MSFDVIVVGAGIIGASIAYHLSRSGARVLSVERGAGAAPAGSASWASAGGLRSQGRDVAEQPLTRMAAARWFDLRAELAAELEAEFGGHLHVAETGAECAVLYARFQRDRAGGIAVEWVEGAALRGLAPGLVESVCAGVFSPGDGQAHPGRVAAAFLAAATRFGCVTRMRARAQPELRGGSVVGISLDDGTVIEAGTVVLATGAWSVRAMGAALPVRWRGLQMLLSEVAARDLRPTVTAVGRNLSLKQGGSGQYMIGGRWLIAPGPGGDIGTIRPEAARVAAQWQSAAGLYPALAGLDLAQCWAGAEAQSLDGLPVLGFMEPGLYLAFGFSGHGFQLAPAVGDLVAGEIAGTAQSLLTPFRPSRFAETAPAAAAAFMQEAVDIMDNT